MNKRSESLEKIANRMSKQILATPQSPQIGIDYNKFYFTLKRKLKRIKKSREKIDLNYLMYQLPNPTYFDFSKFEQIINIFNEQKFRELLKREVDIKFSKKDKEQFIYDQERNLWLKGYRLEDKLVFENDNILGRKKIQVYSSPNSITRKQDKHLCSSSGNWSKFSKGVDVEEIDYISFNYGLGHLDSRLNNKRLFFYLIFNKEIGKSLDGIYTNIIKSQIDLVTKKGGRGYQSDVHSYPISEKDFNRDFEIGISLLQSNTQDI